MDKRIKKMWVDALRSGEYEQGRGMLKRTQYEYDCGHEVCRYCVLGVLCDLYEKETGKEVEHNYFPTFEVAEWAGWVDGYRSPRVEVNGMRESVLQLNDAHHWTFEEIADLIEEQM